MDSLKNFHECKQVSGVEYHGLVSVTDCGRMSWNVISTSWFVFFSRTRTISEASALPFGKKTMEMTVYACLLAFMCTSGQIESRLKATLSCTFLRCVEGKHHFNYQANFTTEEGNCSSPGGELAQADRSAWCGCIVPRLPPDLHMKDRGQRRG